MTKSVSLNEVRRDPFCLDALDVRALRAVPRAIVTNESFQPLLGEVPVRFLASPAVRWLPRWAKAAVAAVRLTREMRREGAVGLVTLGSLSGSLFCFLRSFSRRRGGPVLAYRALLPANPGRARTFVIRRILKGADWVAVWSRAQVESYHQAFGIPKDRLLFMPYKANHSKSERRRMPVGDYLFSGGNSERDYKTLFEAVRGLPIPVVVSTNRPGDLRSLEIPGNVILVSAREPAFERLMAGSRAVALCLKEEIIRGSGGATMLNAMWHGRPTVVADNVSSADYIRDGVDGFVVPAGSAERLRGRILELWRDPGLAARVGEAAREKVAGRYTHRQYKARMQALAMLVFSCKGKG